MEQQQEILDAPAASKVAVYNPIEAGIQAMLEKHGGVLTNPPVVTGNATALAAVKLSLKELVKFRTSLESTRVAEKAASLAYGKLVDTEAKRIQAFATPLEQAYAAIVTAEEDRLEAIRQAELEAERQRIAALRARIQVIKDVRETANMCRTAERVKQLIDGMPALFEGDFQEFQPEAETAFNEVCTVLQQLHDTKVEAEAQAAEVARQRAELAAQQAENDRKAAIQTKLTDIRMLLVKGASCTTSVEIARLLKEAGLIALDPNFADTFADFASEAEHTVDSVSEQLEAMHKVKFEAETAAADLAQREKAATERQADLDRQKRTQDARDAAQQAEQQVQASKPMVSRVVAAVVGQRPAATPALNTIGEVTAAVLGESHPIAQAMQEPPRRFASDCVMDRPSDIEILGALADHFDGTEAEVVGWIKDMNLVLALEQIEVSA